MIRRNKILTSHTFDATQQTEVSEILVKHIARYILWKLAYRAKSGGEKRGEMGFSVIYNKGRERKKGKYQNRKKDATQKDKIITKLRNVRVEEGKTRMK